MGLCGNNDGVVENDVPMEVDKYADQFAMGNSIHFRI